MSADVLPRDEVPLGRGPRGTLEVAEATGLPADETVHHRLFDALSR